MELNGNQFTTEQIFTLKSSLYKPAVSFSINKSDIVTSVSQSLKEDKLFNIKKDIYVIPNFIELDKNIQDPDIHVAVLLWLRKTKE
jgi:hypothetical protein